MILPLHVENCPFSGVIQWRKGTSCWIMQAELPLAPKLLLTVSNLLH